MNANTKVTYKLQFKEQKIYASIEPFLDSINLILVNDGNNLINIKTKNIR